MWPPSESTADNGRLPLHSEQDIVAGRQQVRKLAQQLRFSLVDQTKIVTAASELARNAVVYGGGGELRWQVRRDGAREGLQLEFEDRGPGIPDLELAMTDGWTSGQGLGMGLSGSKRLVHDFEVRTARGEGTCVTVCRWK
ncbi:MAG: anti-sigma regulatory factor [Burkholderiales bacterium]|jgi:serine/threonine-protein kinase RsbT|nr:anti-sigma regulatory factor [Burkholderiales bacterium]